MGNPLPVDLPAECRKADKVLRQFVDPVNGLDRVIPLAVLRRAKGFAIFSIFRLGFLLTARAGSGVVIVKLADGSWSAPSALGIGGIGGGFSAGAEVTDFIVVLNSRSAVRSFMATGSLQLGGNLSVAVGPVGRSAEASGALNSSGKVAAMFSYSKSQGLFGGISLEGTILVDRSDANHKAYGRGAAAKQILAGSIDPPAFAMALIDTIERLSLTGRMSEAARADATDPGAGRESWELDEDRGSAEYDRSGSAGHDDSGLDTYLSQAELKDRRGQPDRGDVTPGASRRSPGPNAKLKKTEERDPFATSEDEETYSMNRENATRNAGTYAFSPAGGGSASNSPSMPRGGSDYGRSRSGSKSAKSTGYFDDYVANSKEKRMSPVSSKRPSFGHRKSSSSFSLSRFGIGKGAQTPPLSGMSPTTSRKTPPPGSLLNEDFRQNFTRSSESEDDRNYGDSFATANGTPKRDTDPYLNGGLRRTSPADAIRAAAAGRGDFGKGPAGGASGASLSSSRQHKPPRTSDAFDDLWDTERAREELNGMDPLDRELQSGSRVSTTSKSGVAAASVSNDYYGPTPHSGVFSSPQRPASGSQVDRSRFSKSPTFLTKSFRTGSGGGSRSKSYTQAIASDASDHDDDRRNLWSPSEKQSSSRDAILGNNNSSSINNGTGSITGSKVAAYLRGGSTSRTSSQNQVPYSSNSSTSSSKLQPSIFDDNIDFSGTSSTAPSSPPTYSTSPASTRAAGAAALSRLPSQGRVIAAFDFQAQEVDDLSLTKGEVIVVLKKSENVNDWWLGRNSKGQVGSFPGNYVDLL